MELGMLVAEMGECTCLEITKEQSVFLYRM
jgi:hypothetical protein